MASVSISRRTFVLGSAAAAAAASLPAAGAATASVPQVAASAPSDGSWGFSLNGEQWYTGYRNMEEALDEAHAMLTDGDCTFEVGYCVPDPFHYPDVSENLAYWLEDGRGSLGKHLKDWFYDANHDHEFDGGLGDEIDSAPSGALEDAVRVALDAALVRAGVPPRVTIPIDPANFAIGMEDDLPSSVYERIERDGVLRDQVIDAYQAWVAANGIENAPRTLSTRDVHAVTATYDEGKDEYSLGDPVPEGRAFAPAR